MNFATNAAIENGSWGYVKTDKDGNSVFIPLGNEVTLESSTASIETEEITMLLSCQYLGEKKWLEIPRYKLTDYSLLQDLAKIGADVTRKYYDVFVDSLRLQEHAMESHGIETEKVYEHLGWKTMTCCDPETGLVTTEHCYRADIMIGNYTAHYIGNSKVEPMGRFDLWRKMVIDHVLGHTALEVILLAGLSAVVNGLISDYTTGENPIFHVCGVTGSGKSTGAMLAASTAGEPFDGSRTVTDQYGKVATQQSVYGSWSATENAVLSHCSGNRGYPIVLNELGKFLGKDLSSLIYNMSEGTDKLRLNKAMQSYQFEGFTTSIISVGKHSLLGRCVSKADGLRVRVLEIDQQLTSSSEQADAIKSVCRKNNGHAIPMLAKYIIKSGGVGLVLKLYYQNRKELLAVWPRTPSAERLVSKFPALLLTVSDLAEQALKVSFNKDDIIKFFLAYEQNNGQNRNSAASSYDVIMEECRINIANFYQNNSQIPNNKVWGRIATKNQTLGDGRIVCQEYMVRPSIVAEILKKHGFENQKTCEAEWTNRQLISRDKDRATRSRKIEPGTQKSEDVYVFRVFVHPNEKNDEGGDSNAPA